MRIITSQSYVLGLPLHIPDWVSAEHVKRYRYGQEPYFQEAFANFSASGLAMEVMRQHTFLLLKTDAFPVRCASRVIAVLADLGFAIVDLELLTICRYKLRELWRYEYNLANVQRYPLLDLFLPAGDSIFLLLRDITKPGCASSRLNSLKGKTDPKQRDSTCIRSRIDARSGTLNHIHTPDTFIDFVREIGVLFDQETQRTLLKAMGSAKYPVSSTIAEQVEQVSESYPVHSLTMQQLYETFGPDFRRAISQSEDQLRTTTLETIKQIKNHFPLSLWDEVTLGNEYLEFNVPGVQRVLEFEQALEMQ